MSGMQAKQDTLVVDRLHCPKCGRRLDKHIIVTFKSVDAIKLLCVPVVDRGKTD